MTLPNFAPNVANATTRCAWLPLVLSFAACGDDAGRAVGSPGAVQPRPPPGAPDIVLVSIDSLRFDHLGCYGYSKPTSPTIDALAASGVRFEQAISTTSWTLPAHAAMFTGLFDSAHGLVDNGLALEEEHRTLAEILHDHGWRTAGFFGGPYLDPAYGLAQGFDVWTSCMSAPAQTSALDLASAHRASHADVTGPRTVEAVARWSETLDDRPYFLFVHLWDVHYDYVPPKEYLDIFDPEYTGTLDLHDVAHNPAISSAMSARDRQHLVAAYDGEIRFTDDVLARILAQLESRGRLANTLLIVTADHGEEFFEHGNKGHQNTLFDEVVRVPLIVRWPGKLAAGVVVQDPVRLVDLLPTVLGFVGIEAPAVSGRDVGPLTRGAVLPAAPALCELLVLGQDVRAVRTREHKSIRAISPNEQRAWYAFDLVRDPGELLPLEKDTPGLPEARHALIDLLKTTQAWRDRGGAGAQPFQAPPELQSRLKAFGYAGDDR